MGCPDLAALDRWLLYRGTLSRVDTVRPTVAGVGVSVSVCVCACVCACVRACIRACVPCLVASQAHTGTCVQDVVK